MDVEAGVSANHVRSEPDRLWTASNIFSVLAMGVGSIGYGYSANVIAPILGESNNPSVSREDRIDRSKAFPSFKNYFNLETRSDGTAILAAMTVRSG
jgi:hypothetical protein